MTMAVALCCALLASVASMAAAEYGNLMTVNACEGTTPLSITCPASFQIAIQRADYGRHTLDICPSTGDTKLWNLQCTSSKALDVVKQSCNNKTTCSVIPSNDVFGDPCGGTVKYLQVQYVCIKSNSMTVNACEGTTPLSITCPASFHIVIQRADYGRHTLDICPSTNDTSLWNLQCTSTKALDIVKQSCNNKMTCSVIPSNDVFGDPCGGTVKYLEVEYICANGNLMTVNSCEHGPAPLSISCPDSFQIAIQRADYGRHTLDICSTGYGTDVTKLWNLACTSNNASDIVKQSCDKKTTCSVSPSNDVFGDPCVNTVKYLEVDYICVTSVSTNANACEYATTPLSISCPGSSWIQTQKADWGRHNLDTCSTGYDANTIKGWSSQCTSPKALDIVKQSCDNKATCSVNPSNTVFGDPCVGTQKYLEVAYACTLVL